ncbi:hypothetical protein GGH91_000360 [Coemansia sp. RSA 2671]|nr:hypothetical protein GGH91_000360 [Coemansia sp. RSA 2671]
MKPLQCPVIQHHLDKELEAIWPEFIKSVENPLFERMLWWILPRRVCINRFRQRALLRDYKSVGCWSSVDYHTYLERLLCHLIPDNFLARHLVHWIFHDVPRGGVCPVDGIKPRAVETAVKYYDYLAFHQSTLLFAHRMLYNDIVARQATDALAQLSDASDDTLTKGGEEYSSGAESACSGDTLDDAPVVVREEPKPLKANRTRGMAPSRRVLHGAADGTQKLSPYLDSAYEDIDTEQLGLELEFCMLRSSRLHLVARYNSKVGLAEHAEELVGLDMEIKAHQKAMDANRQVKESRRRIAALCEEIKQEQKGRQPNPHGTHHPVRPPRHLRIGYPTALTRAHSPRQTCLPRIEHPVPLEADPKPTTVSSASLQQQPRDEASPLETRSDHQEPSDASSSVDGPAHSLKSEQSASLPTVTPDSPVVTNSAAADSETPASQDASDADTVPPSAQQQVRSNVCADAAVLAPVATANDTAACGLHPTAQDASDANVMPASTQQQVQSDHDMDAVLSPPVDEATSNATAETAMVVTPAAAMAEAARAFYIRHKTRAPNATVTRPRQQIPYAALSLNRIAVTRLRKPHDSSKPIKRVIPIRGRQQLTPKARSKATRVDLRHLGLGLGKINPVTVKHCVVSATSTVRPSGGLALRDNRLRRRHRVYSALVKRARQRQRANKRQAARDCALSNRHSAGPEAMECAGASAPVMVTPPTMAVDAPPAIPQPAATLPATQAFEPPVPAQQAFVLPVSPAFVPPVPVPPVIPAFVPTVARPPAFTPPVPVPPVTPVFAPPVPVPPAFTPPVTVPPAFVPTAARPPAFMPSVPVPQALVPSVPVPPVTPVFAPPVTPGFTPPVAVSPTLVPQAFVPLVAVPPVPTLPIAPLQVASPPAPAPPATTTAVRKPPVEDTEMHEPSAQGMVSDAAPELPGIVPRPGRRQRPYSHRWWRDRLAPYSIPTLGKLQCFQRRLQSQQWRQQRRLKEQHLYAHLAIDKGVVRACARHITAMRYMYTMREATGYAGDIPPEQRGIDDAGPGVDIPSQDADSLLLGLQAMAFAPGENNVRPAEQHHRGADVDAPEAGPVQYVNCARPDNNGYQALADEPFGNEDGYDAMQDIDYFVMRRRDTLGHEVSRHYSQMVDRVHRALLVHYLRGMGGEFRLLEDLVEMFEDMDDEGVIDYYRNVRDTPDIEQIDLPEDRAEDDEEYDPAAPGKGYDPDAPGEGYDPNSPGEGYD